jgi:hypothetical protein
MRGEGPGNSEARRQQSYGYLIRSESGVSLRLLCAFWAFAVD